MIKVDELFEKHKNLAIGLILVFILLIDLFLLLGPQASILVKINHKAGALNRDLKLAKKDIAAQKDFENKLVLLNQKIKEFGATVTPEEELPMVLESISRTANQTFVKITQLKPLKEEKVAVLKSENGTYYKIPILIDTQCGYHSLGKFLNELESGPVLMKIVGLEITSNPANIERHLARLSVQLFVIGK